MSLYSILALNTQGDSRQGQNHTNTSLSTDDFALDKPLAQNSKQEGHGIHNRDGKTQFSLANEEKEPDAASEVEHERDGVARVAQQVEGGEEGGEEAGPEPAGPDGGAVEERVRLRLVGAGGAADEGGCEAPGEADENEGEDVVDCWGG